MRRVLLAAVLLSAVALSSASLARTGSVRAAATTINVGYFPNITHAQAILGFGQGVFAKYLPGVTVSGKVFNAGPDEMNALYAGAIDIGYIGPGPAINGYVKSSGAVRIIAGASAGGAMLVAAKKSGITTVADLSGKRVSIPQLGNTQDIELRALLKDNGLKPTESGGTVRVIAVQNADTLTLFKKGDLDAALVPEPYGTRLVEQTGAHIVLDWQQLYGGTIPAAVVIASAAFLKAHPDLVVKFLRAHVELTKDLANPSVVYAPLYKQLDKLTGKGIPGGILLTSLHKTVYSTTVSQKELNRFTQFSIAAGYLKKGADISGIVDTWPMAHLNDSSIK